MDIIQSFYDNLASEYDKLFLDWDASSKEQGVILDKLFRGKGFDRSARVLDCACGIGTQTIGLAALGYNVTASDISDAELKDAKRRAESKGMSIQFEKADFRELEKTYISQFDIIIAMDNALPHMLTENDLEKAVKSISHRVGEGGMFVASIRDYDSVLLTKPTYSPPYIHKTENGQRVSFQTWNWSGNHYRLVQYIIDDEKELHTSRFECEYRAITRKELTEKLENNGFSKITWLFPEETGFYQPIVIAEK